VYGGKVVPRRKGRVHMAMMAVPKPDAYVMTASEWKRIKEAPVDEESAKQNEELRKEFVKLCMRKKKR